ncbi:MAG: S8 family serine peptidase, partial [Roseburia sp.]
MKKIKRYMAAFFAMMMAVTAIPVDLQAENAASHGGEAAETDVTTTDIDGTQVEAVEVEGESFLDEMSTEESEEVVEPLYKDEEMVTVIVELEEAPVMDYYDVSTYSARDDEATAGEAVSEFLASDDVKEASEELLAEQEEVISDIESVEEAFEVVSQWTTVTNAMAVRVPYGTLSEIKKMENVKRAYVEHTYDLPEPVENSVVVDGKARETYSYDMAGIGGAWADGYTGKGMLVAVLDSGIDIKLDWNGNVVREHEAFTDDSFKSEITDSDLRYTSDSLAEFLEDNQLASTTGVDGNKIVYDNNALYKNRKVPYACDYADGDLNVLPTDSDHGTHVSGTIAGYAKTEEGEEIFTGVAPDAQILFMKVFPDQDGGATESSIVNALEDSLRLGADMINLSLGSDNGYAVDDTIQNDTFARVEEAGIIMLTSAGNSAYSSAYDSYDGESLTSNPETSMMSSPAVYDSNLSVASIDNAISVQSYFVWTDNGGVEHKVAFQDPWSVAMKADFSDKEYPVYLVEGTGTYNDYYNAGFSNGYNGGKTGLALVKRGEISFADKIQNAMSFSGTNYYDNSRYGVLGVIVYDNDPESSELINMSVSNTSLDSAFISGKDGAAIEAALKAGYDVKIQVSKEDQTVDYESYGEMSSYTSWGPGSGLELKPEITAPGGNIWSTVIDQTNTANEGYTGSYSMMSGTSMAAPHMTGISALVRQYLTKEGNVSSADMGDRISQLLVSTAVPQKD